MAEGTKKISFGFSKLKNQSNLIKKPETSKPEIDYVDSFDGAKGKFSYKGAVRCDEPVKKELVIPLIGTRTVLEVIKSRLDSKNLKNGEDNNEKNDDTEIKDKEKIDSIQKNDCKSTNLPEENKPLSIDDLAAKEILNELQNSSNTETSTKTLVIKQSNKDSRTAEEMQIDYENIPVSDFGLAMLRGMGWTPKTGIGKNQKVVEVVAPRLRPKGLGLGADKVMQKNASQDPDLTIAIKGYVKFVSGTYKGNFGQVEAMDDDTGRVTVKLALGGMVSTSEVLLVPITKKDYEKNSKVINPMKYEDFKEKAGSESETKDKKEVDSRSSPGRSKEDKSNRHKKEVDSRSSPGRSKEDKSNRHRKERYDRSHERDRVSKLKDDERDLNGKKRYSSSDSSELRSPERSKHKKSKKSSREESEYRKHKKSKKKRKKKAHSSDDDSEDLDEKSHKREKSSHHRHHHHHHHSKSERR